MLKSDSLSRVSIIIPTYNRSQLLRLTVESVLAQTYPNIETIVIDDGSTDDTAAAMAEYAGRIIYIRQEKNQGAAKAIEIGLQAASGEYINSLDHDDLFMPTKIERQVQILESRPDIDLVYCQSITIDKDGNLVGKATTLPEQDILKELVMANFIWSGAPLLRRCCLEAIPIHEKAAILDWNVWLRIALAGHRFACVQEPLGAYRVLQNSMMSNVASIEKGAQASLDNVFSNSQLPLDVLAVKDQAYAKMHFGLSGLYYAARQWDDAQRNLTKFLTFHPCVFEQPATLWQYFWDGILKNFRIAHPITTIKDMFDHLPPIADGLLPYRLQFLSSAYVTKALQCYVTGEVVKARRDLEEAVALYPDLLGTPDLFVQLLVDAAMNSPVSDPFGYVDVVFQHLPDSAQKLRRAHKWALGDVSIACAFQDHAAGHPKRVVQHVLHGVQCRPSWLKDRGVVSIFTRSLPAWLTIRG